MNAALNFKKFFRGTLLVLCFPYGCWLALRHGIQRAKQKRRAQIFAVKKIGANK